MFQLMYISHASRPMSDEDLQEVLNQARKKNINADITGLLVYHDGTFIQLLEGDESAVRALADIISQDERHKSFNVLAFQDVSERSFADWSMGYKKLDPDNKVEQEGYNEIMDKVRDVQSISPEPSQLVEVMKKLIRANV